VKDTRRRKKREKPATRDPLLPFCRFVNALRNHPSLLLSRTNSTRFARTNIHKTQISSKIARASFAPRRKKTTSARFPPLRAQKKISLSLSLRERRFPRPPARREERKNTQRRERRIPRVSHESRAEIPSGRGKDKKKRTIISCLWFYMYVYHAE
jgi:hypothetical protein